MARHGYSPVYLSPNDYLLELIEHTSDTNRDKGLALWSETFDRLFVAWDISNCRRLLRIIKQSRQSPDTEIESQVIGLSAQGMLEIHLGNSNEAINCYKKALVYLQSTGSGKETEEAWLWSNLGNIYYLSGNFKAATESYSRSVQLYQEAGDEKGVAVALSNQGNVFRDSGELEKALACYHQSITWLQTHAEGEYLAITLANLGTVLQLRGTSDEAEAAYRQALEIFTQLGNLQYQVQVLGSLGILFLEVNQLDRALDFSPAIWR
jgi:tetratricopeptide (TPR) repeat protein